MRLIDADALIKELDRKHYSMASRKQIYSQPTIYAVPVVRGKWIEKTSNDMYKFYVCNACKFDADWKTPYCPNCGADMSGMSGEVKDDA